MTSQETFKPASGDWSHEGEERKLLSFEELGTADAPTPLAKAMEYAERAEFMYIAPAQATVSALLALFWLKVAELEGKAISTSDAAGLGSASTE